MLQLEEENIQQEVAVHGFLFWSAKLRLLWLFVYYAATRNLSFVDAKSEKKEVELIFPPTMEERGKYGALQKYSHSVNFVCIDF